MKELITLQQADMLMLALLVVAPIAGAAWGVVMKRLAAGLGWGAGIGVGNFALWKIYNAITDSLGLDTVKNLLVNLGLFIVIGVGGGVVAGILTRQSGHKVTSPSSISSKD